MTTCFNPKVEEKVCDTILGVSLKPAINRKPDRVLETANLEAETAKNFRKNGRYVTSKFSRGPVYGPTAIHGGVDNKATGEEACSCDKSDCTRKSGAISTEEKKYLEGVNPCHYTGPVHVRRQASADELLCSMIGTCPLENPLSFSKYAERDVYIWNPLSQFTGEILTCRRVLNEDGANCGGEKLTVLQATSPRIVECIERSAVLIGVKYKCMKCGAIMSSYSDAVMDQLSEPVAEAFPFLLAHRSGISKKLFSTLQRILGIKGATAPSHTFIRKSRSAYYYRRCAMYFSHLVRRYEIKCRRVGALLSFQVSVSFFFTPSPPKYASIK